MFFQFYSLTDDKLKEIKKTAEDKKEANIIPIELDKNVKFLL